MDKEKELMQLEYDFLYRKGLFNLYYYNHRNWCPSEDGALMWESDHLDIIERMIEIHKMSWQNELRIDNRRIEELMQYSTVFSTPRVIAEFDPEDLDPEELSFEN